MQSNFATKEVVWAKVRGYPWWPAEIVKLPTSDHNFFKVIFIAQQSHAFLNPKDVRKYAQFYDQSSKKKTKGLGQAIVVADQLFKKRNDSISKSSANKQQKSKQLNEEKSGKNLKKHKIKKIRKSRITHKKVESCDQSQNENNNEEESSMNQDNQPDKRSAPISNSLSIQRRKPNYIKNKKQPKQKRIHSQQENNIEIEEDKWFQSQDQQQNSQKQQINLIQSEEKPIDRTKIDKIQEDLLQIIDQLKNNTYANRHQYFVYLSEEVFTGEELAQSKITNMLKFISINLKQESEDESNFILELQSKMKEKIIKYLTDTSYYDQYIKVVTKNKRNRTEFENKLIEYLRGNYSMRSDLACLLASKLSTEVINGSIIREKDLLQEIKEKKINLSSVNNKAAIERVLESIVERYS